MNAALISDIAILLAGALIPAALTLFLLRRGLSSSARRFWRALTLGLICLSGLAVAAIWGAVIVAEGAIAACASDGATGSPDCANSGLIVPVIGAPAAASVVVFLLGAVAFALARKLRRAA